MNAHSTNLPRAMDVTTEEPTCRKAVASQVTVDDVSMVFGEGEHKHVVFEHISFDVSPGEIVCIVGASGCGKTTLLRQIAGLQKPTSGAITYSGETFTRPTRDRAIVFQDYGRALLPWRSVTISIVASPIPCHGSVILTGRSRLSMAGSTTSWVVPGTTVLLTIMAW